MSEEEIKASIRGFYSALMAKDLVKVLSFFTEDAVLFWGPFTFGGKQEIKKWATELEELFQSLWFGEKKFMFQGNGAINDFYIGFLLQDGQKGSIPGTAVFEFKNGKIQQIKVTLFHGYFVVR